MCYNLLRNGYSEHEAFWLITQLIEKVLPVDFYFDMRVVMALVASLNHLLEQGLPSFVKYAKEIELSPEIFLVEWLVTLFTKDINLGVANYILELLVVDGIAALIGGSLAALGLAWKTIRADKPLDQLELLQLIRSFVKDRISLEEFRTIYHSIYLNQDFLELLFDSYLSSMLKHKDAPKKNNGPPKLPPCSTGLPICLHILEVAKTRPWTSEISTMKVGATLDEITE